MFIARGKGKERRNLERKRERQKESRREKEGEKWRGKVNDIEEGGIGN